MATRLRDDIKPLNGSGGEPALPLRVPVELPDGRFIEVSTGATGSRGGNFKTHKIVMDIANRMEVKQTLGIKLFYFVFAILGVGTLAFLLPMVIRSAGKGISFWLGVGLSSLVGITFTSLGLAGVLGYVGVPMPLLDRRVGLYWKGRTPKAIRRWARPPLALEQIAAVQICSNMEQDMELGPYPIYEINLVMADPPGERVTLMCHGKQSAVENDAKRVAEFLGCPLLGHG